MAFGALRLVGFSEVFDLQNELGQNLQMGQMVEWNIPVSDSRVQEDAACIQFFPKSISDAWVLV